MWKPSFWPEKEHSLFPLVPFRVPLPVISPAEAVPAAAPTRARANGMASRVRVGFI
jgi:hypothetical protein